MSSTRAEEELSYRDRTHEADSVAAVLGRAAGSAAEEDGPAAVDDEAGATDGDAGAGTYPCIAQLLTMNFRSSSSSSSASSASTSSSSSGSEPRVAAKKTKKERKKKGKKKDKKEKKGKKRKKEEQEKGLAQIFTSPKSTSSQGSAGASTPRQ